MTRKLHWRETSLRIEPSRRHGHFDPRFLPKAKVTLLSATTDDLAQQRTQRVRPRKEEIRDWESEGGAIAELPQPDKRHRRTEGRTVA